MGQLVEGAQNIFFAELACPQTAVFNVEATRFMSGKFPLMIFGLPGAALAMYHMAKSNKKKIVGGLLLSAALTSLLTGITEPIEFTFLFVAPLLYIIHVVGAGLAYMLMHILKVGVGMTFSGGAIDLTLFGILQGNAKTNWLMIVLAGIGYFAVYYFVFKFLIQKLNLKTPGREDDNEETKLYTRQDVEQKQNDVSKIIVEGLGGKDNISDVDNCITRLRMTVHDPSKVDEEVLKQSGCKGVVCKGPGVQIIFGPRAANIKSELEEYLHHSPNTKATNVFMPITGRLAPISETPDETFAQEMMGKGICIFPTENVVYSPVNGTISMVFPTKHALGIISDEGVEILVHVGIDTVTLNGEAFEVFVQQGDKVVANQKLIEFDLAMINEKATSSATPIVFTNLNGHDIEVVKLGDVKAKEVILKLK